MSDQRGFKTAKTESGRTVIYCLCGGGPAHKWEPYGGGMRILACPHDAPEQEKDMKRDGDDRDE